MLYSSIDHISSENDWRILEKAHQQPAKFLAAIRNTILSQNRWHVR